MSKDMLRDLAIGLLLLTGAIALPFVYGDRYTIGLIITFFFNVIIATQWNLLYGYAGVFSLAQLALYGFGAYGAAMLAYYWGWNIWVGMPVAALGTVVFALAIGYACLRLTGVYVALLTLAIAQAMYLLITSDTECFEMIGTTCRQFTGGSVGFSNFGNFGTKDWLGKDWLLGNYFIVLAVLAVSMLVTWMIIKSPIGLAFRALRDNPGYAVSRGLNRFKFQLMVFAVSSFFTGLAGGFYAAHYGSVAPNILLGSQMLLLIAMVMVGGVGRFWGPLVGAAALMVIDEVLRDQIGAYRTLGIGLILVIFMVLVPGGVLGNLENLFRRKRVAS